MEERVREAMLNLRSVLQRYVPEVRIQLKTSEDINYIFKIQW